MTSYSINDIVAIQRGSCFGVIVDSRTVKRGRRAGSREYTVGILTGAKKGCNEAECGSCTVLLDGKPVLACLLLMGDARDREILTVEGLVRDGEPHPLQSQMAVLGGVQCGYCTPGIVMSAYALLEGNPDPSEEEVRLAISGNICRCTGYVKIVEAVRAAADLRRR